MMASCARNDATHSKRHRSEHNSHQLSSCLPRILNEQFSSDPIRGISACKVYPPMMLPSKAVSSYLTFSSFPRRVVIFCGTVCSRQVGTRLLTGALLCVVRTFLPDKIGTIAWLVAPKESFGQKFKRANHKNKKFLCLSLNLV